MCCSFRGSLGFAEVLVGPKERRDEKLFSAGTSETQRYDSNGFNMALEVG